MDQSQALISVWCSDVIRPSPAPTREPELNGSAEGGYVTIIRAGREEDARPPREKKPRKRIAIHPGLVQVGKSDRCLRCDRYLDWDGVGLHRTLSVAICECGIWLMTSRLEVRWLRFSSEPFMIGTGPVYAPKEKKLEVAVIGEEDEEPLG